MNEEIRWFPMRVTYNRELIIKEHLDRLEIENFIPMRYDWEDKKRVLVPAIHNIIFIHSTQDVITELKISRKEFEPLRYIMQASNDGKGKTVMFVPDRQMNNFLKVASVQDDSVFYLYSNDFIDKIGKEVKITDGPFKGVEGVIKRIKKNKYVVVQIEGVAAVAITYVPSCFITLK